MSFRKMVNLAVTGISCAGLCCQGGKGNSRADRSIASANVNFALGKLNAEYDKTQISVAKIISGVDRLGYKAVEAAEQEKGDRDQETYESEIRRLRKLFNISLLFPMPLVICMAAEFFCRSIACRHLFLIPIFIWLWPPWCSFMPVFGFIARPFLALRHESANMSVLVAMGTSAAYLLSLYNTVTEAGMVYFETSAGSDHF